MTRPYSLTLLASGCLACMLGCEANPLSPDSEEDVPVVAAFNPGRSPVIQQTSPIFDEFGSGAGVAGQATLTRSSSGIWLDVNATGLTAGHAYTVWYVIFDNSKGCGKNGCDINDLGSRKAQVTLGNAGGFVAGAAAWAASMHLNRHDFGGRELLLGDPSGIDNTYRAEVHIVLRSHGTAEIDPADLARQTSEFDAFCNLPVVGCDDQGVAVFTPPGAPGKT